MNLMFIYFLLFCFFLRFSNEVKANQVEEVLKGETNLLAQSKLVAAAWRELSADQKQVSSSIYTTRFL